MRYVLVALLLALQMACKSEDFENLFSEDEIQTPSTEAGTPLGSCNYMNVADVNLKGTCREFRSTDGSVTEFSLACGSGVEYTTDPCPTEDLIGRCSELSIIGVTPVHHYYGSDWTTSTAEANCQFEFSAI